MATHGKKPHHVPHSNQNKDDNMPASIQITDGSFSGTRTFDGKTFTVNDTPTSRYIVQIDGGNVVLSYQYPDRKEASRALQKWDGTGHPPGRWVLMTGTYNGVEYVDEPNPDFSAENPA